ncbi:MAG: amidohydrolase family protein, partial [Acidobacteriota bacterium]
MKRYFHSFALFSAIALLCFIPLPIEAQGTQSAPLVIEGGTLIDGTGGEPIRDALIVIRGNRIETVSRKGQANYPAGARVVRADGKFIIPGLIDSHVHYREYMGEMFLAYGVTAVYDLGNPFHWQTAVRKGLNEGKIRGPRFYFCARVTLLRDGEEARSSGPTIRSRDVAFMRGPEDARQAVAILQEKADCVKLSEFMQGEIFVPIAREARAAGMGVISHSLDTMDSVHWGISGIEHMTGIAISTIHTQEGRAALKEMDISAGHKNSFLYQWMEPAYFDELIHALVQRNVFINPTLHFEWKALTERAPEHELEDARLLNHPDLQYVPLSERLVFLGQYHWADKRTPEEKEQFRQGYRKVQEFLRRFVQAGGKIYSGTDTAAALTPGLSLHHEMELLVDAGLTPMQSIQSSTLWAAEIIGLQDTLGAIEPDKFADLVSLRANPLLDIRNVKAVDQVIRGGEIMDTSFHGDYQFPFRRY